MHGGSGYEAESVSGSGAVGRGMDGERVQSGPKGHNYGSGESGKNLSCANKCKKAIQERGALGKRGAEVEKKKRNVMIRSRPTLVRSILKRKWRLGGKPKKEDSGGKEDKRIKGRKKKGKHPDLYYASASEKRNPFLLRPLPQGGKRRSKEEQRRQGRGIGGTMRAERRRVDMEKTRVPSSRSRNKRMDILIKKEGKPMHYGERVTQRASDTVGNPFCVRRLEGFRSGGAGKRIRKGNE